MEVTIKIEGLDQLTEAVAMLGGAMAYFKGVSAEEAVKAVEEVTVKKEESIAKAEENLSKVEEKVPEKAEVSEPSVSRDEVRALFAAKNTKDKRTQLKGILDKYGAKNISSLKEEDFDAIIKDLEAV